MSCSHVVQHIRRCVASGFSFICPAAFSFGRPSTANGATPAKARTRVSASEPGRVSAEKLRKFAEKKHAEQYREEAKKAVQEAWEALDAEGRMG